MLNRQPLVSQSSSYILTLFPSHIRDCWLNIPKRYWHLFPDVKKLPILLVTDKGDIQTMLYNYSTRPYFLEGKELRIWFNAHPELKAGDKVRITAIESMKYRLEILRSEKVIY